MIPTSVGSGLSHIEVVGIKVGRWFRVGSGLGHVEKRAVERLKPIIVCDGLRHVFYERRSSIYVYVCADD